MKILSWNIRHGSSLKKVNQLTRAILSHKADIVFLIEFRHNTTGNKIIDILNLNCYTYTYLTDSLDPQLNKVICFSKIKLTHINNIFNQDMHHRVLHLKDQERNLICLHIPGSHDALNKKTFWDQTKRYLETLDQRNPIYVLGDFNTGLLEDAEGTPFKHAEIFRSLFETNWIDVIKYFNQKIEYTWYSPKGNGFRVDHVITQKEYINTILEAQYSHIEREEKLSDHSLIIIKYI
jgi:exonuclease III